MKTNLNLQLFNLKKINIFAHYDFLGLGNNQRLEIKNRIRNAE